MCMDAVSHLVMNDPTIQEKMANPILDLVHKQVLMTLYSMEAGSHLDEFRSLLPIYLGRDWQGCEAILNALQDAGLLRMTKDSIELVHRVNTEASDSSCGCAMHH